MKLNSKYTNILIIFLFILFVSIYYYFFGILKEKFEMKIPNTNPIGDINDKRWLSLYDPQNSIFTSNVYRYWKKEPSSYNSNYVQDLPPPLQEYDIALPVSSQYGTNDYRKGLLDYNKLMSLVKDDDKEKDKYGKFESKLINPKNGEKMEYEYEVQFELDMLNRKSWIDRWKEYNPEIKKNFQYKEIQSPIEDVNKLNMEFQNRCNVQQQNILTNTQLVMFGIIPFDIYKYKIQKIEYNEQNKPLYYIQVVFFRESDLYVTTLSYQGLIDGDKIYIFEPVYIGGSAQDNYVMADGYEKERNYQILNKNYSNDTNKKILELNPDNVVSEVKKYQEGYKINNQFTCFNTDPDVYMNPSKSDSYILRFNHSDRNNTVMTREQCESYYDWYGRLKPIGILDSPCKKDEDCPYYKSNKNYENKFGKCGEDGKCELPVNMKELGYRYFSPSNNFRPMCYNCKSKEWNISTPLDTCCDEQYNKEKYPFLDGPDYAYENDYKERYNHYVKENCYTDSNNNLKCNGKKM